MTERNAIQRGFDQFGKAAGLQKHSGSWYRRSDEVVSVSNLQKSQYGPQYYFNQAFWLPQFGDEQFPKENKCHIRARLGALLPPLESRIDQLLDLEYEMPDDQRISELAGLLNDHLLPLLIRASTVAGLRALNDSGALRGAGITGPAQSAFTTSR